MGRYFGREPHYSQAEAEAQAKQAIDAAVNRGRPPDEEWRGLASRMGEINQELATRRPAEIPPPPPVRAQPARDVGPRPVSQILRPRPAEPVPEKPPAAVKRATKASAAAPAKRAVKAPAAPPAAAKRAAKAAPAAPAKRASKASAQPQAQAPAKRARKAVAPTTAAPAKRPAAKKTAG